MGAYRGHRLSAGPEAPAADGTDGAGPLRVTDAHLSTAPDQLLDTRNQLTRVLLGGQREPAAPPHQ
jgi:hypothetical protein